MRDNVLADVVNVAPDGGQKHRAALGGSSFMSSG
jgi:hypothetical protein